MRRRLSSAALAILLSAAIISLVIAFLVAIDAEINEREDMYGGLPARTHAIADAGGMCHGEPR